MKAKIYMKTLMTALLLFIGVSAWADTVTLDPTSDKSFPKDGITIKVSNGTLTNGTDYRVYKSAKMTISSSVGTITNIALTYTSASYDGGGWASSYQPNATSWTSPTANGEQARITSIVITYVPINAATAPTLPKSCTFTGASYDVTITNGETGATVYYTTDGSAPTTSSTSFTGASTTFSINATTTVKAMAVIDGKSNSSIATATYTKETSIANTAETAYTVAEAKALIDTKSSQLSTTKVYVKGTISKIDKYDETDKYITYWLDDNAFEIFRGKGANGADFASIDDIKVGGTVVVYGLLTTFGTTYELGEGNWLTSYTAPAVSKNTATLTITKYLQTLKIDDNNEVSVSYDGDGTLSVTSSDPTVAKAVLDGKQFTVTALKAGTTTITVSATETDNYNAASKSYTLTVKEPDPAAELPFSFDGGKSDLTTGMTQSGIGTDYTASPKLKFDDAGDYLIINYNGEAKNVSYTIKGNSTSSKTVFDVLESADGKTYTSLHSHTYPSTATKYTDKLKSDSRYVKFVYTTKVGNVALGAITITNEKADAGLAFAQSTYRFMTDAAEMKVAATSAKGSTGAITYALTTGDSNHFIIDNTGNITCDAAGTYTVTATIAETDDYKSGTATCTVKVKEPVAANSIIVAESNGKYFAMTNTAGGGFIESVQIAKVGDKYYAADVDAIKYCVTTTEDGKASIVAMNGQYLQATAAKAVSFTDDEYQWTWDKTKFTAANTLHGTLQFNTSSPRFTTYTSETNKYATIVSLADVATDMYYTRTATAGKYGTICLPYAVKESDIAGAEFYTATVSNDYVTLESVTALEAGKPYIFKATDSDIIVEMSGTLATATTNGSLTGVLTATEVPVGAYVMQTQGGTQQFYQVTDGNQPTLAANRAYIDGSEVSGAKSLAIGFNGETTAIKALNAINDGTARIYDINGRTLPALQKGINIVNGVKVIVK